MTKKNFIALAEALPRSLSRITLLWTSTAKSIGFGPSKETACRADLTKEEPMQLTEKELRQTYRERTCCCGSYVSKSHQCFTGHKEGLSFVQWIAEMSIAYPKLGWMRDK